MAMTSREKDVCATAFIVLAAFVVIYITLAQLVWDFRNPKANERTHITHFFDVIQFKKLDKFQ